MPGWKIPNWGCKSAVYDTWGTEAKPEPGNIWTQGQARRQRNGQVEALPEKGSWGKKPAPAEC